MFKLTALMSPIHYYARYHEIRRYFNATYVRELRKIEEHCGAGYCLDAMPWL
jgi:hypothetical protein